MSEADLEACIGSPDQHNSVGGTDIATYEFTSSSTTTWQLPLIQGPSFSNGGNCRMTVRFDHEVADSILYSGEKNGTGTPDSYCAPIVRTCLARLDMLTREKGRASPLPTPAAATGVPTPPPT